MKKFKEWLAEATGIISPDEYQGILTPNQFGTTRGRTVGNKLPRGMNRISNGKIFNYSPNLRIIISFFVLETYIFSLSGIFHLSFSSKYFLTFKDISEYSNFVGSFSLIFAIIELTS